MADHNGDLSQLAPAGVLSKATSSGLLGYIGTLSQTGGFIEIHGASNSVPSDFNANSVAWLKANPSQAIGNIYVSVGESCLSGSSGYNSSISTADAAVYAPLSNGTLYCVNM